jgi:hypothetical protein
MQTIRIAIDEETYDRLSASAVRELRPVAWHVIVLLRRSLGLPFPPLEREPGTEMRGEECAASSAAETT